MDAEQLRGLRPLDGVSEEGLARVAACAAEVTREAGQVLALPDDPGSGMYVIREGTVAVIRDGQRVATMGPGQFFGEISVLDGGPRTADVRADQDTVCLTLISWEVKPLLMEEPNLTYKMLLEMVKRLRSQSPRDQD